MMNLDSYLASPITKAELAKPDEKEQDSMMKTEDAKQITSTDVNWTRKENKISTSKPGEGVNDYPTLLFSSLARLLVRPTAKAVVLLLALGLLSLGIWSAINLDTEFKAEWLVDMDSSFGR